MNSCAPIQNNEAWFEAVVKGDIAYITQNMEYCATFRDRRATVQDGGKLIIKGFAAIHYAIALDNFEIF